ncbi:EfeM/EfeO family lipoprotein [Corynebacterium striatum]|uniref:EfeM/EfeO family lipoprotein n=1 Tax=Corynebacterium striatum TaxID=43770 RepID=UPI0020A2CC13|nr:EfeM/EfeO family lipoprotein [Corynebacterium striatum]
MEAGDLERSKELFALARTPYERIEPVAESFPDDLDPRIDLREADIEEGDTWTGFHKIEKDLWVNRKITDETKKDAAQLKKDIAELVDGVAADDYTLTPVQIASGAQGLLDEIATSKITGEEDIFSHTDLYDFQANLDGSKAAIASLEKALNERDPQLLTDINERFEKVQTLLDKYKELSDALDVLTEKVSTVQEVVAK